MEDNSKINEFVKKVSGGRDPKVVGLVAIIAVVIVLILGIAFFGGGSDKAIKTVTEIGVCNDKGRCRVTFGDGEHGLLYLPYVDQKIAICREAEDKEWMECTEKK